MIKSIFAFCISALISLASMTAIAQDEEARVKVKFPWGAELNESVQAALQSDSVVDELQGIVVLCNTADTCEPAGANPMQPKMIKVRPAAPERSPRTPADKSDADAKVSPGEQKSGGAIRVIRGQQRATSDPILLAPGEVDYQCNKSTCSCEGAGNCIAMVANDTKCRRRTVVCTEKGCRCTPRRGTR